MSSSGYYSESGRGHRNHIRDKNPRKRLKEFSESSYEYSENRPAKARTIPNFSKKAKNEKEEVAVTSDPYAHDPDFHGAEKDRHCTDVFMLVVFILYLCGMIGLLFYCLTISNIKYLYIPTDHRNLLCGHDNRLLDVENASILPDLREYPYLFWARPGKKGYVRSFCVKECPNNGTFFSSFFENMKDNEMEGGGYGELCNYDEESVRYVRGYKVPYYGSWSVSYYCSYNTTMLMDRCMPTLSALNVSSSITDDLIDAFTSNFSSTVDTSTLVTIMSDLIVTWKWIAAAVGCALVLSFLWVLFLRYTAAFFVWATVLLAFAASAALTYFTYQQKEDNYDNAKTAEAYTFGLYSTDLNRQIFTILYWVCIVWDSLLFLIFLYLCDKILLSVRIIKIVSLVFSEVKTLFLFPIVIYLLLIIWWAYVIGVAIIIFGSGRAQSEYDTENGIGEMVSYNYDKTIQFLSIYHFVGFIWVSVFISDLSEMTLAGVFASWYFNKAPRRERMGNSPVWYSFKRALRYHTGSLATGSLIISICKILRYIISYIQEKTKDTESTAIKVILKCIKCCLYYLEKFLKYINRNCYILIAIHGYTFFEGCKRAFDLLLRNIAAVVATNWVGDFTLFLGRVFVTGIVTAVSLFAFNYMDDVSFYIIPSAIVAVLSFIVSASFTNLFEMGIDSMFLCYMEDLERNKDRQGEEMYGPPELVGQLSQG